MCYHAPLQNYPTPLLALVVAFPLRSFEINALPLPKVHNLQVGRNNLDLPPEIVNLDDARGCRRPHDRLTGLGIEIIVGS